MSEPQAERPILTPDQRVRVFVSSTLEELAVERAAVREAVDRLHLSPILFELGARAHPPRSLYRSYLEQSHVFVGIYWERYGWVAPAMEVSGLEDEYLLAGPKPKLMYIKRPAPKREDRLEGLLERIRTDDDASYKGFSSADELESLVGDDLATLLSEAFLIEPDTGADHADRPRFTLPGDATTFLGREPELDAVRALLERDDVRLVTLTGPGGIGKTRLGLRAAAEAAAGFEEGAAFVSLGSVRDAHLVPAAIAAAVGLRDNGGITADALRADLADRSLLLVLDNFEHVMAAASLLPEILRDPGRLKVLVTSREALRLQAEHEFAVPPMTPADSMRMFTERAAAVGRSFTVDAAHVAIAEQICRRLEGVPLAIELAAARTKLLSPEAILDRLEHRLGFLIGGARDLPERQQALRTTIEWSYDLLDDAERDLFAIVGIFVGSFSLAAIEAISSAPAGGDELDLLASLVDKSLLRVEATAGEPRFRMLGMIAELARTKLDDGEDADRVAELHALHYRDVGLTLGGRVTGPDQRRWLQALGDDDEGEAGNLRAALAWLVGHGRLDDFAELVWALWVPAWINGRIEEGHAMAKAGLAAEGELSPRSRGRLLVISGMFGMWSGDHDEAMGAVRAGREAAEAVGDDEAAVAAVLAESMMVGPVEGEERAEQLALEALAAYERLDHAWGEAAALNALGWLFVAQERFDGAQEVLERTLERSVAAGDEQFSAMAEVNLAEYHLHRDDVDTAATLLESCVQRHRSLRLMYSVAYVLDGAARLAAHTGDHVRAARLIGAASALRGASGISVWGSQLDRRERLVAELRAALGASSFEAASAAGAALSYADALDEVSPQS